MKLLLTFLLILFTLGCQNKVNDEVLEENKKLKEQLASLELKLSSLESKLAEENKAEEVKFLKELMKIDWDKIFEDMDSLSLQEKRNRIEDMRRNRQSAERALSKMIEGDFTSHVSPGPSVKDVDLFFEEHKLEGEYMKQIFLKKLMKVKYKLVRPDN